MSPQAAFWKVRCRAVWEFVLQVIGTILSVIGRILWGVIESVLALFG